MKGGEGFGRFVLFFDQPTEGHTVPIRIAALHFRK